MRPLVAHAWDAPDRALSGLRAAAARRLTTALPPRHLHGADAAALGARARLSCDIDDVRADRRAPRLGRTRRGIAGDRRARRRFDARLRSALAEIPRHGSRPRAAPWPRRPGADGCHGGPARRLPLHLRAAARAAAAADRGHLLQRHSGAAAVEELRERVTRIRGARGWSIATRRSRGDRRAADRPRRRPARASGSEAGDRACPAPACGPCCFITPPATRCPTRSASPTRIAAVPELASAPVAATASATSRCAAGASSASSGCSTGSCSRRPRRRSATGRCSTSTGCPNRSSAASTRAGCGRSIRCACCRGKPPVPVGCGPALLIARGACRRAAGRRRPRRGERMSAPPVAVIGAGFGGLALAIRLQSAGVRTDPLREARQAGRPRLRLRGPGLHLRRRADGHHGAECAGGTVRAHRAAHGRLRRDAAGRSVLPAVVGERLRARLQRRFRPGRPRRSGARTPPTSTATAASSTTPRRCSSRATSARPRAVPGLVEHDPRAAAARRACRATARCTAWCRISSAIPELRQAFSFQSLLIGGNPFSVSSIYALIHALERTWGVYFPRGGTHALVRALVRLFEDLGGELRLGSPVDEIRTRNGRVAEVCTADGRSTPVRRGGEQRRRRAHLRAAAAAAIRTARARRAPAAAPAQQLAVRRLLRPAPPVPAGRAPHGDLRAAVPRTARRHLPPRRAGAGFLALPAQSLAHRSLAGAARARPPATRWRRCRTSARRRSTGSASRRNSATGSSSRSSAAACPACAQEIVTTRVFTPLDFERELNAHVGSAFSLEPLLTQSAFFRVHNRDPHASAGCISSAQARTPAPACRAWSAPRRATAGLMLADLGVAA